MSIEKPREIALRALHRALTRGEYIEAVLEKLLTRIDFPSENRRLTQELVYGTVRWQATLDWLIAQKTKGRTQKLWLQLLLRLGLYQIFWLERIPDHAAVHETVQLAKTMGFAPQSGFINAVLRNYIRDKAATQQRLSDLQNDNPSLGLSHPAWLCDKWEARWGRL